MPLPADQTPSDTVHVNARVAIRAEGGVRVILVAGIALHRYDYSDEAGEALGIVCLIQDGHASVTEVARVFDRARLSIYRYIERYEAKGVAGLVHGKRGPKAPSKLRGAAARRMIALKRSGVSNRQVAVQLGVTEAAVRGALKRAGYSPVEHAMAQPRLLAVAVNAAGEGDVAQPALGDQDVAASDVTSNSHSALIPPRLPQMQPKTPESAAPEAQEPASIPEDATSDVVATSKDAAMAPSTAFARAFELATAMTVEFAGQLAPGAPSLADASEPASTSQPSTVLPLPAQTSADTDPSRRSIDRLLARMGLLDDAAPLFGTYQRVPGAGVLLAVPALLQSGVFGAAHTVYGSLGAAFYGLRNVILTLLFMALLRVKRAEALRHTSPLELGRLLGLDRAPEVKTLRRKLQTLADRNKSEEFVRELARARVKSASKALGFLYVDGHVRVYNGKHKISKAHVTQMRLSMPATVDHWVCDASGDPFFVVTATPTNSLASELPAILSEVRGLIGDRRLTVVFDRGGWSPKLFKQMIADGFDILTYRKGRIPKVRRSRFEKHSGTVDGREASYMLAERKLALLKGTLRLREVVRLSDNGKHQTSIVTSRMDLSALELAYRMFERWRQENFFKYMSEEFALDVLVEYGVEDADGERLVPNPARKSFDKRVAEARAHVRDLEHQYGAAAADNQEARRPTMRGFKIANGVVGQKLREARDQLEQLIADRRGVPTHVPAKDAVEDGRVVRLCAEAKRLTDGLKMVAYQAETALFRLVAPYYSRSEDEGRKLIASCFRSVGDITVADGKLQVILEPAASPNRTRAIAQLCEDLNATQTLFPGSSLRLRFSIKEA